MRWAVQPNAWSLGELRALAALAERRGKKIAMGTKAAAAVVVGFVVNFLTMILAPGQWLPLVLYIPLVGLWWWRHGQRRYFSGTWEAPDADLRGWVALFFLGFLTHKTIPLLNANH